MFKVNREIDKTEYTNKTFRLPSKLVDDLQIIAQQENVSLNKLVIQCCNYALNNLDQSAENKGEN